MLWSLIFESSANRNALLRITASVLSPWRTVRSPRQDEHLAWTRILLRSATHQRHELYETDFRVRLHLEFLIELGGLPVSNQNEKTVSLERTARALELLLPVDLA